MLNLFFNKTRLIHKQRDKINELRGQIKDLESQNNFLKRENTELHTLSGALIDLQKDIIITRKLGFYKYEVSMPGGETHRYDIPVNTKKPDRRAKRLYCKFNGLNFEKERQNITAIKLKVGNGI